MRTGARRPKGGEQRGKEKSQKGEKRAEDKTESSHPVMIRLTTEDIQSSLPHCVGYNEQHPKRPLRHRCGCRPSSQLLGFMMLRSPVNDLPRLQVLLVYAGLGPNSLFHGLDTFRYLCYSRLTEKMNFLRGKQSAFGHANDERRIARWLPPLAG